VRILHIASAADWDDALVAGAYRVSTLGVTIEEEGFIHASTAEQVQATASRFYADVPGPLVVLVLDSARLEAGGVPVLLEDAGTGELFPHLYAELPVALVDEVRPARFGPDGDFVY
jgi:uncharacterized protein (DUF952 family)